MWWSVVIVSRITSWVLATLTFKEFCWNLFDIFTTFITRFSCSSSELDLNFSTSAAALVLLGAVSAQDTHHCPDGWFWHVRLQSNLPLALLILWHVFSVEKFKFPNIFVFLLLLQIDCCQEGHGGRGHCYFFSMEQVLLIWNWYGKGTDMICSSIIN